MLINGWGIYNYIKLVYEEKCVMQPNMMVIFYKVIFILECTLLVEYICQGMLYLEFVKLIFATSLINPQHRGENKDSESRYEPKEQHVYLLTIVSGSY